MTNGTKGKKNKSTHRGEGIRFLESQMVRYNQGEFPSLEGELQLNFLALTMHAKNFYEGFLPSLSLLIVGLYGGSASPRMAL